MKKILFIPFLSLLVLSLFSFDAQAAFIYMESRGEGGAGGGRYTTQRCISSMASSSACYSSGCSGTCQKNSAGCWECISYTPSTPSCPSNCKTCSSGKCSACNDGYYLYNKSGNKCVPADYILADGTKVTQPMVKYPNYCSQVGQKWVSTGANSSRATVSCADVNCGSGMHVQADGYAVCKQCNTGYALENNRCILKSCPAGQFLNGTTCTGCAAGTYSDDGRSCKVCPDGTYAGNGAASCTKCPAGTYASGTKNSDHYSCKQCPNGSYASGTGNSSCKTSTVVTNCSTYSKTENKCITCNSGFTLKNGQCVCPAGQFLNGTTCTGCAAGTYSNDGQSCKQCPNGSYASGTGNSSCKTSTVVTNCSTYSKTENKCTACNSVLTLKNGQCVLQNTVNGSCPNGLSKSADGCCCVK